MGWDQSTSRQDVQSFLLDFLGVDALELLREAIRVKLAERGLTFTLEVDESRECGDGMCGAFHPHKVTFSDGRVFEEVLTEVEIGDDWGNDYFSLVESDKPFEFTRIEFLGGDGPDITREEVMALHWVANSETDD